MSSTERAADAPVTGAGDEITELDQLPAPEGSPVWPADPDRPTGSHTAYPQPTGPNPSAAMIAGLLVIGVALFILGVLLMRVVI